MIRFLYKAQSKETKTHLSDLIRQSLSQGKEVLLLVPEQETVTTERRMLVELPQSAQLSFEVVNFSRLANRVFRKVGGHHWHTATPAVRSLLMWRTMRHLSPFLQQYAEQATQSKLCDMMLDVATRCRAHCIQAEALLQISENMDEGDPMKAKLLDLGTVLGTFEAELSARFDNGDDDLDRLADILHSDGEALFGNTDIFVDSFTDYTGQEIAVLRALMASAGCVSFTFPQSGAGADGLHLSSAVRTHKHLKRIADELSLEILTYSPASTRPDSAKGYLAENLFCMGAEPAPLALLEQSDVTLIECSDPFSEAEAAAAEIHRLVREGCRYRDIAVILRDANSTVGILDNVLEREGIPFFLSEKTDITVRPLVKLILLALRIQISAFRDEDVIAYLKTGLCGIPADDINCFEEYVRVWHPRGEGQYRIPFDRNPDGFSPSESARAKRILETANRVREALFPPLQHFFAALKDAPGATGKCRALYAFLQELQISERLKSEAAGRLAAGERREAEELARLYSVTIDALENLSKALEEEPLSVSDFADALRLLFSHTDMGSIPTSSDEVTVGSASMLRADSPRFVLALSLNEGVFPQNVSDDGLLSDVEKARLKEFGIELPSSRAERASDELFYIYRTFLAPTDALYLSYCKASTAGGALTPSIAITRAKTLLCDPKVRLFEAEPAISHIYTPAGALDRFSELPTEHRKEIGEILTAREIPAAKTLSLPVVDPKAAISEQSAAELFREKRLSPSHLESFASCRFAYYCERVLSLREEKHASLAASETGNFIHYVLERIPPIIKKYLAERLPYTEERPRKLQERAPELEEILSPAQQEKMRGEIRAICTDYRRTLEEKCGKLTPRAGALMDRLTLLSEIISVSMLREFADSDFETVATELDLREIGRSCTLPMQNGDVLPLTGKVDRLDIWRKPDGGAYLHVVDYKTGTRTFSPSDIPHGISLQMPLYLAALCNRAYPFLNRALHLPLNTVLQPAGVTYFSSAISTENTRCIYTKEAATRRAADSLKRSSMLLQSLLHETSHSADPAIVGSARSKAITLTDAESFQRMFEDLGKTVSRLSGEMSRGLASAAPNPNAKQSPCQYCRFAAICRTAGLHNKDEEVDTDA